MERHGWAVAFSLGYPPAAPSTFALEARLSLVLGLSPLLPTSLFLTPVLYCDILP